MELTAVEVDIGTRSPTILLNRADATELGVRPLDRVQLSHGDRISIGIVEVTDGLVSRGTLGVTRRLGHVAGVVDVTLAPRPVSVSFIRKKLDDVELEHHELRAIVEDIDADRLNDVELAAYVTGTYTNGLSLAETRSLTEIMTDVGESLVWKDPIIADKHSIGGVAGNRITPIVVSIVAAAGIKIPKTSSRAITSPAGTADTMAVFCPVEFTLAEIQQIVEQVGGCLIWGGGVNLSPVDDKIIRVETPLSLDPPGQIIASVLSKKKSAGSTHVVIDIPYGEGAKVRDLPNARELAEDFKRVGEHLGLTVECTITSGSAPIGRGIGPVLEARDVLAVLDGGGPKELRLKSLRIAEILLGCCTSDANASTLLESGAALAKFREIVAAQGGDPDVTIADLVPGGETVEVRADRAGVVTHIDNALVSELARRAGAPKDAGAGLYLNCTVGEHVEVGHPLFTIHAEHEAKLAEATQLLAVSEPVRVRSVGEALVERI
ncbi:AMP phosphorylase [Haladaptatus sp. QDMS2]|uniref:AMP phosphorylase n=1 Tax=Haladaptatus sp. QDMS2 TaxID=3033391 RepID=UPI0023E7D85F|nr:AMP phosphorylase [Haladaptatus sp. QDMS2]